MCTYLTNSTFVSALHVKSIHCCQKPWQPRQFSLGKVMTSTPQAHHTCTLTLAKTSLATSISQRHWPKLLPLFLFLQSISLSAQYKPMLHTTTQLRVGRAVHSRPQGDQKVPHDTTLGVKTAIQARGADHSFALVRSIKIPGNKPGTGTGCPYLVQCASKKAE